MNKSNKGKLKRQERKKEAAMIAAKQIIIDQADSQENPLAPLKAFQKLERNGLTITFECHKYEKLDKSTQEYVFKLCKTNMEDFYENCDWGWNDKNKLEEMSHDKSWYLIARINSCPIGFSHFRYDLDYGDEVLYCYELQLEKQHKRKGIGKFMIQILELIAFTKKMKKVILTILKNNPEAYAFFKNMGYSIDETSPQDDLVNEFCYEILSKFNKKLTC